MMKSRGKATSRASESKKRNEENDYLVGSITEKLEKLGDETNNEIGDSFGVLTDEVMAVCALHVCIYILYRMSVCIYCKCAYVFM